MNDALIMNSFKSYCQLPSYWNNELVLEFIACSPHLWHVSIHLVSILRLFHVQGQYCKDMLKAKE